MELAIITPCLAKSREYIRMLDASATRHAVPLKPFGIGSVFTGWKDMTLQHTVPELRRLAGEGYTHVLCADGIDCLFVAGVDEIIRKYQALGSPVALFSHDDPVPVVSKHANAGLWMGEPIFLAQLWEDLSIVHPSEGNPQLWLWLSWPMTDVACDTGCQIFQSVEGAIATAHGRFINTVTESEPCVLHFRGGYCDPETGREERTKPVLEALYG